MAKKSVKKKGAAAKTMRPKRVAMKKAAKPKKAGMAKKAGTAKKRVMPKKAKKVSSGKTAAKKTLKKPAPKLVKKKATAKPQRSTKAKPGGEIAEPAPKPAPKPKPEMTSSPVMPMAKASWDPLRVLPEPKAAASVMPEAGKAAKLGLNRHHRNWMTKRNWWRTSTMCRKRSRKR